METAKQQRLEQTYQTILKVGFGSNDYDLVADLISPNFVAFGTALDEKIFGHNDLKALLQRQKEQGEGLDINLNINNLYKHFSKDENTAVYIDEVILSIANDGEKINMVLRLSMVLEYIEDKWLMVHFHSSKPEDVESEKDTWGIETWKEKAEQLEKEVAERTADLVLKNRDLEIESALERVRSASMAMHKTEDIAEVVLVYFKQLKSLNVEFIQAWITIFQLEEEAVEVWFSPLKGLHNETQYFKMPSALFKDTSIKSWKNGEPFSYITFPTKSDVDNFMQVCDEVTDSNYFGKTQDKLKLEHFEMLDANHKYGCISKSNTIKASQEERDILQRFAKVFEQTYTRFLDLQKAEEQAREAQIEAALERVRTASMTMQKTEGISEVVTVLFDQLNQLNVPFLQIWITILNLDKDYIDIWMSPAEGVYETSQHFTMPSLYFEDTAIKTWRSKAPFSYRSLKSELEIDEFINACDAMTESTYFSHGRKIQNYKKLEFIEARHEYGFISKSNTEVPTKEEEDILQRFAKVFEQAYTRFLDIEKAEAQAREAQIDAALERIRARSMAMQSSDELSDVLAVLFRQYDSLGIKPINAWLSLFDLENNTFTYRATGTSGKRIQKHQVIDLDAMDIWQEGLEQWKSGKPEEVIVTFYPPEIMPKLMDVFSEVFAAMPESERINPDTFPDGGYNVQGYCKFGYIGYNHTSKPTDEEKDIVRKFAKEFGRLYQRFLDIEKAEAQAREAQIEAALEKVRNRSLVMQTSDELQEVVHLVAEKMQELGVVVDPVGVIICTYPEGTKDVIHWTYTEDNERTKPYYIPYFKHPIWDETYASFNSEDPYFSKTYQKKDKHSFLKRIYTDPNSDYSELPQEFKDWQLSLPLYNLSFGWGSNSAVLIPNNDGIAPNESQKDIIIRFAKVFDQCYIRFLDLKKSEAQAREAEIQLALERVRASSLAMKSSEDLTEVLTVLFSQFNVLGIQPLFAHLTLFDEKNNRFSVRMTGKQGQRILAEQYIDVDEVESWKNSYNNWQNGQPGDMDCIYYPPEVLEQVLEVLKEINDALPKGSKLYAKDFPNGSYTIQANFEYGYIGFNDDKMATEEQQTIVKRFAKEFSSAYRRFLDIEKAEAQAREAKIEAALEKVRSTSMAMHKSTEMQEVANAVYEQMKSLGLEIHVIGMSGEIQPDSPYEVWVGGSTFTEPLQIPYTDSTEIQRQYNKAIAERPELYQGTFSGKVKKEYIDFLISESDIPKPLKKLMQESSAKTTSISFSQNSSIQIVRYTEVPYSEEDNSILVRFAKVFNQAYIRFLDLQKAEAQTREAQIEASLERIRAKSMAMHHPSELSEVLTVMFEQLDSLGVKTAWTHLSLIDLEKNTFTYRMTGREGKRVEVEQVVAIDASDVWIDAAETFKSENPDAITRLEFKPNDLPKLWDIFDGIFSSLPEGYQIFPEDFPNGLFATQANCKFGYLGINQPRKATEEEEKILGRFGNEFGRLYQRYLDIEKAQLQARKAQIEASLERVRAKAMAMHQTDELTDVLGILFDQFEILGVNPALTHLTLFDEDNDTFSLRITTSGKKRAIAEQIIDVDAIEAWRTSYENWKKSELHALDLIDYKAEDLPLLWEVLDEVMSALPEENKIYPKDFPNGLYTTQGHCKFGYLGLNSERKATEEEKDIVVKFAKEFGRLYQRFLDLQKAEAQTREAQIEAAMERIRSRALAMRDSNEIMDVITEIRRQIDSLGQLDLEASVVHLYQEGDSTFESIAAVRPPGESGEIVLARVLFPVDATDQIKHMMMKFASQESEYTIEFDKKMAEDWQQVMLKHAPAIAERRVGFVNNRRLSEHSEYWNFSDFSDGSLLLVTHSPASNDTKIVLKKASQVFDLAYKRFKDLQKAETQAREAQIEAALEKVRSRTMAMQTSSELPEAANTLFLEVQGLGIPAWSAGYCIWNEDKSLANCNMSSEGEIQKGFMLPTIGEGYDFETPLKKGEKFHVASLGGKKLVKHYDFMKTLPGVGDILSELINSGLELPTFQIFHICYFNHGYVMFITYEPVPNAHDIFKRFSAVFEQTYTRFLDLERAEAQTREAQVEMALEKVRSRTMAMQKGEELKEVVVLLYKELIKLGVTNFVTCGYVEINEATQRQLTWVTNPGGDSLGLFYLPLTGDDTFDERYEAWKNQQEVFHQTVAGKVRQKHLEYAITTFNSKEAEEMVLSQFPDPTVFYCFNFPQGYLHIISGSRLDPEEENLLARFTRVFEQTYTRFLDLERAEAQAKESQIEMALEKVRSRTMAMQHSDELQEAAQVLFNEVQNLGIPSWSCGYNILSDDKKSAECWMSSEGSLQEPFTLTYEKDKYFIEQYNFFKSNKELLVQEQKGKDLQESYEYMKTIPKIGEIIADLEESGISLPTHQFNHLCKFNKGYLLFITYEPVPDAHELFLRFTKVFEQTYTRFLDLKRAEAQAREAQIEAALERVRSQSMGMQSTDDFGAVTTEMFNQLRNFGEDLFATGIVFCDKHEGHVEQWHSIPGAGMVSPFIVPIDLDYIHQYRYDQWKKGEELFSIEIPGDFIEQHFEDIFKLPSAQVALKDLESRNAPMPEAPPWEIDYGASFEHGYVLISSLKPLENTDILLRFTKVFEQAYTRFLDLKRAEAQARESQIEAALEKVRSQSLSMQQPNELNGVVQLIAEKLQELDVILDLGGVVICTYFPDSKDVLHWIATPDSESSGKFLLPYFDHVILKEAWASKNKGDQWFSKAYSIEEKNSFFEHAFEHSDYKHFPDAAKKDILKRKHHTLSFAWSKHSALLIPSYSGLMPSETERDILIRFAKVFEHAYIRFMDLQEKEVQAKALFEEKQRLEETLSDLQTTQKQLIQSEKMASLGELTAGIAHEIQNPLNFVNNFSEVSKELLEEMEEEIKNGDFEEVKAIMADVIQNLEKINHHGQRADGIVKGMLQHSRASGDKKEPTDINKLADEYMRLAYHGLRAKNKQFNATLETNFDEALPKVHAIPQDIGRVILNLFTNAFYAVDEKKANTKESEYEPTVSVTTKQKKDSIEITVSDNANGIPNHIKDKIFQPFFTTKPTGQGTGLGLSMSYDIITKGHGGDISLQTRKNKGTSFIIKLPTK